MKLIQYIGIICITASILLFSGLSFYPSNFNISSIEIESELSDRAKQEFLPQFQSVLNSQTFSSISEFRSIFTHQFESLNSEFKEQKNYDKVMYDEIEPLVANIVSNYLRNSSYSTSYASYFLGFTFGLGFIGGMLFILPLLSLFGVPGIRHDGIYHNSSTSKGWVAYLVFAWLILFYIILYFFPAYLSPQIVLLDPISKLLNGGNASRWFLYGSLYTYIMFIMGIRMLIKYRHNNYQMVRTGVVFFFQLSFAFLIPEILVSLNLPYMDFKNAWPLDYDFFFEWNINKLIDNGTIGAFMLIWGIVLTLIIVPVFVYIYGKRWYCSWVCGCGGLAETLGDPYRQHSDKSLPAWKFERYSIHAVLVFAIVMTGAVLYTYFSGSSELFGINTFSIRKAYGFAIGSIFSGVIGTGFYPIFGNRVWCRFGCPLAAYMGLVQRFKSKFRITTNGGQCISCGNCSTYCEQGIDVRWYAQRGQDIVRASCVGCGVCSAVCPRGVLKLENGPVDTRILEGRNLIDIVKMTEPQENH